MVEKMVTGKRIIKEAARVIKFLDELAQDIENGKNDVGRDTEACEEDIKHLEASSKIVRYFLSEELG